jgi:ketosteroid isomerase-like protein
MTAKETVQALYAAYAAGDAARIRSLLHPDVIWVAPAGNATQVALGLGDAADAGPPQGLNDLDRDAIVAFMANDYPRFFADVAFEPRSMIGEGDVVLTEHRMSATLPNGRPYVNDYCFVYEVADGRVMAIREYMDTRGGWLQVFGGDASEVLLEGTPPGS